MTTYFDTANAFPSTSRQSLREAIETMTPEEDHRFHFQRLDDACMTVPCQLGTTATVLPTSGELMGDHGAPEKFIAATTGGADLWAASRAKKGEYVASGH